MAINKIPGVIIISEAQPKKPKLSFKNINPNIVESGGTPAKKAAVAAAPIFLAAYATRSKPTTFGIIP